MTEVDWVHKPTEFTLCMVDAKTRVRLDENQWPVIPNVGDTIDTRMGMRYRVVGRHFAVDSLLTIDIELEEIKD